MTEPTLDTLNPRLERLEREVRGWRIVGFVAAAIFLFVGASPQSPVADKMVAREFILVDDAGIRRAMLRIGPEGPNLLLVNPGTSGALFSPSTLALFDKNGKARVQMDIADDIPAMSLRDAQGKTRAGLLVDPSANPRLSLFESGPVGHITIGYTPIQGLPMLVLLDKDGKTLWKAP